VLGDAPIRGEVVVVIEGARDFAVVDLEGAVERARELTQEGRRKRDAARQAAAETGVSVNTIYDRLVHDD
jgi:16S rRNA (cytidine1402-2'-O)-methyltransferase